MIIIAERREAEEQNALRMAKRHDMPVKEDAEREREDRKTLVINRGHRIRKQVISLSPRLPPSSNVNLSSTSERIHSFICSS